MSGRNLLITGLALVALLIVAAPAWAQAEGSITVRPGAASGEGVPGGATVVIPVTVDYTCQTFIGVQDPKIELTARLDNASAGSSATVDPSTLSGLTTFPDCLPNDVNSASANVTVTIGEDIEAMAGASVDVIINASATDAASRDVTDERTTAVEVGSLVVVTYAKDTTTLTAQQGDLVTLDINATSASNTPVKVEPRFPDWNLTDTPPDVLAVTIAAPGGTDPAAATVSIPFEVPDDAEAGTHTFTVQLVATSEDGRITQTENISYELTVESAKGDGGSKDSPGPALPVLVLTVLAAVALRRRR